METLLHPLKLFWTIQDRQNSVAILDENSKRRAACRPLGCVEQLMNLYIYVWLSCIPDTHMYIIDQHTKA